jgi:hypothetical protein
LPAVPRVRGAGPDADVATVVKVHVFTAAIGLPATSVAPVEIVAVNVVFEARVLLGFSVTVVPA